MCFSSVGVVKIYIYIKYIYIVLISQDCCWYCVNFIVAFPCWSRLFCGQIWYVPAITAGPWWRGMLHSNCSAEALPHTPLLFLTITWLLCVCILSGRACTHLGGGMVRCTIVQDAFEWHPMSALWNTSVHLNFYLGDGFACCPAFQIEFVWKICNIFSISFSIFAFCESQQVEVILF